MIVGRTESADGGLRRRPIRHTQIVDETTRADMVNYLNPIIYQKSLECEWIGCKDIFPNLPEDIIGTPLEILYIICSKKFANNPKSILINLSKYLGMVLREAVYSSEVQYFERMIGPVRKYCLKSKSL